MAGDETGNRLRKEKERVEAEKERVRRQVEESARAGALELSSFDQHPADLASDLALREQMQGIFELFDRRVERVEQALERATAGICIRCGRPIERERLALLPETEYCARCARELEEGRL
ncbi:MAG: TraR/DksA C4-type zinc finger protein [Bacillota bacterium]|nr:TraR/DksA C4-type zinc finger protein [Bacillota bacterium]